MKNNTWLVAITYVGAVMGAGFASGQELWQYFGIFGNQGLLTVILAGLAFAILGCKILSLAKSQGWQDQTQLLQGLLPLPLAKLAGLALNGFLLAILGTMLAAVGALLEERAGLPKIAGIVALWLFLWFALKGGEAKILRLQSWLVPPLVLTVLAVCLITIHRQPLETTPLPIATLPFALSWGVMYVGYNMLGAFATLIAFSHSSRGVAGLLGGIILGVLAMLGVLALSSFLPSHSTMPLLYLAGQISPNLGLLYTLMMVIAILTTALTTAFALINPYKHKGQTKAKAVILLLALPVALVDFTVLVAKVYSIFGILGALLMVVVIFTRPRRPKI